MRYHTKAVSRQDTVSRRVTNLYQNVSTDPVTLAQILLILACSSRLGNRSLQEFHFAFQQGPWAGGALDLIPLDEHMAQLNRAVHNNGTPPHEWKDVSEGAVADVAN